MAIEKRKLDYPSLVSDASTSCSRTMPGDTASSPSRNVRPRIEEPFPPTKHTRESKRKVHTIPILRKHKRYSSCLDHFAPPLTPRSNNIRHVKDRTSSVVNMSSCDDDSNDDKEDIRKENAALDYQTCKSVTTPVKNIRFHNSVRVISIPSRFHYPKPIRKSLWGNLKEISDNARRNTIEFASEGWNWRLATEDDAMYTTPSGEKIHPAHVIGRTRVAHLVRSPTSHVYRPCPLVPPSSSGSLSSSSSSSSSSTRTLSSSNHSMANGFVAGSAN